MIWQSIIHFNMLYFVGVIDFSFYPPPATNILLILLSACLHSFVLQVVNHLHVWHVSRVPNGSMTPVLQSTFPENIDRSSAVFLFFNMLQFLYCLVQNNTFRPFQIVFRGPAIFQTGQPFFAIESRTCSTVVEAIYKMNSIGLVRQFYWNGSRNEIATCEPSFNKVTAFKFNSVSKK